ncbi:hypothetical protein ABBQ32_013138 [Trebouxia sp. C0010 RCD-2024]
MAVICRAAFIMLMFRLHGLGGALAAHSRHLLVDSSAGGMPSVKSEDNQPIQSTQSNESPQFVHATCAVFLDNSTIFTAKSNGATVMYRGVTATIINYASHSIPVPWSFQLSSNSPGYSGIEQAFNFADSRVANGIVSGTATAKALTLLPKAANNITIGLLLQANAAAFPVPQAFKLNDRSCSVVVLPSDVPPPADITRPSFQEVQAEAGTGFTTLKGRIIDRTSGEPISLRGFNWFGFDNAQTCVDGLWAGSTALSRDLATIMRTQQALGFNAVRLLTSFQSVFGLSPLPQSRECASVTPSDYEAYLTDPATPVAEGATIPNLAYTPPATEGICSDYLDAFSSSFERYMFVINLFARNGFYVVLDNQLNTDPTLITEGQDAWLGYWRQIATAVAADQYAVNKVIIDGLNEPDSYGIRWEPTATRPGYGALMLSLMDALYPILPGALFFIEGSDQDCGAAPASNWGDGFASQPEVLALFPTCGISNPGPVFFQPLLSKPYLSQVVISPHVYGPSISQTTKNAAGQGLWTRLSQSFGYLNKVGFGGHVFPIAIGEFGTYFAEEADQTMFADLAKYMLNKKDDGSPVDDLHNPITSFFWFAWNANSGDTGGLVNSPNWDSIVWQKVEYLQRLGLAPWYTGEPPSTAVAGAASPSTPPVSSGPNPPNSPSSGPASPATPSTPSPPMQTPCIVTASYTSVWQDSKYGVYMTAVSLIISNTGSQTLPVPWSVTISSVAYTNVQYSWN